MGLRPAEALTAAMAELDRSGLNEGSSGNISLRLADGGFLITPSGVPAEDLTPEHMVRCDDDGTPSAGGRPSSEWRFHRDILARRPEVGAVVHAHPPHATALACLRRPIPPFHYMVAVAGGDDVRCAPYALFGTQALSDHALAALEGRRACLLANHGLLALGSDLNGARRLAITVERLAQQYLTALQVAEPVRLSAAEMAAVQEQMADYGQPGKGEPQ
jgi:L-fuculose-phosphate aldolase